MAAKVKEDSVISSPEDKRKYRGLQLSNDLKVMLISDELTDKSAAALDVHIGCLSDPRNLPGLAHFCEHMLFMGTEKYPCENEYNKYLSEHGGSSNAYTAMDHTNYFFDVAPDALSGALDRFSQFFICPLFLENSVEREVNAVNSEHEKNAQNDVWRHMQLERSTSNPEHDFCKFGTGNRETLSIIPKGKNIDVRKELLEFHKKYYSANVMALSILGKESLDELESIARDRFSSIKNHEIEIPSWEDHPFRIQECCKEFRSVPIKDLRNLSITFPIPDLHSYYKTAPGEYLGNLIGHEGTGSLLSFLKGRGWVSTLSGGQKSGAKGFSFFIVNVDLTEDGINHTDEIIHSIFSYFNLLKQEGAKDWFFDECKALNDITFRFKDKENPMSYVCTLAEKLHKYPLSEVLIGGYALTKFDPDLINWVLSMLKAENIRVNIVGKANECVANNKEEWYGTSYCIKEIPNEKQLCWQDATLNENLTIPSKNKFIPDNFDLQDHSESLSEFPALICRNDMCSVWYKLDTEFNLPKACDFIELFSPLAYVDPHHTNLMHMFVELYKDNLTEFSYDASLSGLSYNMFNTKYGLTMRLQGYYDKQSVLLGKLAQELVSFTVDPQRFNIVKENYARSLKNFACEQPHNHLVYYTSLILSEQAWSKEDLLSCLDELTIENLEAFIPRLLANLHLEFFLHGSLSRSKAEEMCSMVMEKLSSNSGTKSLLPQQYRRMRECLIEPGSSYVFEAETTMHNNSAVEVFLQFGAMTTENNMLAELLVQIINEPAFDQLRTKEQLGYIVWCGLRRSHGTQGLRVIIQGERHPDYLDLRIEAFLKRMESYLLNLTAEEYEKHLSALCKQRLERPKRMASLSLRWWSEITSNHLHFDRDQVEVDYARTITKEQLLEFYSKYVLYSSTERRKLAVYVISTAEKGAGNPENPDKDFVENNVGTTNDGSCTEKVEEIVLNLKKPEKIECIPTFKMSLGLYPVTKPTVPLNSLLIKDSKAKL